MAVWHSGLACNLDGIWFPSQSLVTLHFPGNNCCDMSGAIELATGLNPHVRRIETFSGDKPDTCYMVVAAEQWPDYQVHVDGTPWLAQWRR